MADAIQPGAQKAPIVQTDPVVQDLPMRSRRQATVLPIDDDFPRLPQAFFTRDGGGLPQRPAATDLGAAARENGLTAASGSAVYTPVATTVITRGDGEKVSGNVVRVTRPSGQA